MSLLFPRKAADDASHEVAVYPVSTRQFSLRCSRGVQAANLAHLLPRQFVAWVRFAAGKSTAGNCILRVVFVGARYKVLRVAARGIVARMTDYFTRGYFAVREIPREAMRRIVFALPRQLTVTRFAAVALPRPASIRPRGCFNECPERSRGINAPRSVVTVNKTPRLSFDVAEAAVTIGGNRRGLSTATFAKTADLQGKGKLDILIHADASSQVLAKPRTFAASRGFVVSNYITLGAEL